LCYFGLFTYTPTSDYEASRNSDCFEPSKHVDFDGNLGLFFNKMQGYCHIFIPILTCIFNIRLTTETFPALSKHTPAVPKLF
jgi:hypothetical protein